MWLLAIAIFGLLVPNGLFIYWFLNEYQGLEAVLADHLAVAFVLDALMAVALLCWLFASRPPGKLRWPWFLAFSLLGGLGFAIPFYLWLNRRLAGRSSPVG